MRNHPREYSQQPMMPEDARYGTTLEGRRAFNWLFKSHNPGCDCQRTIALFNSATKTHAVSQTTYTVASPHPSPPYLLQLLLLYYKLSPMGCPLLLLHTLQLRHSGSERSSFLLAHSQLPHSFLQFVRQSLQLCGLRSRGSVTLKKMHLPGGKVLSQ